MDIEKLKLRGDLDFFPVQSDGRTVIMIQDRLSLVEKDMLISPELYKLMTTLDGKRSMRDIQLDLIRQQGGSLVSIDEVQALLEKLDSSYLLDSPRYREARNEIISDFSAQKIRYCSHAGLSYPKQEEELSERLETILATQQVPSLPDGKITALIAPHIDLEAGKRIYSTAYQAIKGVTPERIIILGVGHSMTKVMLSLTTKMFETPLGKVKTDKKIVGELMKAGKDILSEDDFAHRDEHSIEFQLIFLQHILRDVSFTIVPILCGSLIGYLPEYSRERYQSIGHDFLSTLADLLRDDSTIVIAGVDLSHVGPKFGHDMPASLIINESERHDRQLLHCLCTMNADGFWSESKRIRDKYNVCGFSVLACLLETLPPSHGHLLDYEIFKEDPTRSAVSFAAAIFTR
ncbi:MAG: AmmeMemoRadiSam system protein B [Deltaproteobacteria bacterium]|nr:MAG: AmmeMemoRadiSam system protein B [Deltaproteobacteria bacterium]